jgi:ABC-2 type transport system permease protein
MVTTATLHKLLASTLKEMRIVLRDPEGLGILFVMPVLFVIIMSLALQDFFSRNAAPKLDLVVLDADRKEASRAISEAIGALSFLRMEKRATADFVSAARSLREEVRVGKHQFALLIPPEVTARHDQVLASGDPGAIMNAAADQRIALELAVDPGIRADQRMLAQSALERILFAVEMQRVYTRFTGVKVDPRREGGLLRLSVAEEKTLTPTATQQNVPAYSLLAIFLLVVPLSGAFIKERSQGTLARLRAMPVPGAVILGGKILPYFAINLLQTLLCLSVGRYLLPLLGGDALQFGHSYAGIALLAAASSLAAIGFGLLVAMFARTPEQATAFGAAIVLILAALGGVMVPKMLMPPLLQSVAGWSPLGWALDGFLILFLRNGALADVLFYVAKLLAFAAVCFAIAIWRFSRLSRIT